MPPAILIGCAGWSIPRRYQRRFPAGGSHLQRYAARLSAVEINSSFYREHRRETYQRWAAVTPAQFRFAVKLPRTITHLARLRGVSAPLARFVEQVRGLGRKLGPVLVQLPPSLAFAERTAEEFFRRLRGLVRGPVVCEPRHPSWFAEPAERLLVSWRIARAAVDPQPVPAAKTPGGWRRIAYYRLHGSPEMYVSAYGRRALREVAEVLAAPGPARVRWCIFDNTAGGAAWGDALTLAGLLGLDRPAPRR